MKKNCPRCSQSFVCGKDNIETCQCASVFIPYDVQLRIKEIYPDCLCLGCLLEIKKEYER